MLWFLRLWFTLVFLALTGFISLVHAQDPSDRVWIAGRYDGNRVIVYFNVVKFGDSAPQKFSEISAPVAQGFFNPVELPPDSVARFQTDPKVEQFHLGDSYDLQMSSRDKVAVKLTSLIGFKSDEAVGNDSYIGALATLTNSSAANGPFLTDDYYILRAHVEPPNVRPPQLPKQVGYVEREPIKFSTQTQIAVLLGQYRQTHPDQKGLDRCNNAGNLTLSFMAQSVRLATGELRYYVRAGWKNQGDYEDCLTGELKRGAPNYVRAFWFAPQPTLHIVSVEERTSGYGGLENILTNLVQVVDLGGGKTGLIVHSSGVDDVNLALLVYRDGTRFVDMPNLQSIGQGE